MIYQILIKFIFIYNFIFYSLLFILMLIIFIVDVDMMKNYMKIINGLIYSCYYYYYYCCDWLEYLN